MSQLVIQVVPGHPGVSGWPQERTFGQCPVAGYFGQNNSAASPWAASGFRCQGPLESLLLTASPSYAAQARAKARACSPGKVPLADVTSNLARFRLRSPREIALLTHEPTREAAMTAFARSWRRE
jgi:hypothetical protein